jgi:hypothetical protein
MRQYQDLRRVSVLKIATESADLRRVRNAVASFLGPVGLPMISTETKFQTGLLKRIGSAALCAILGGMLLVASLDAIAQETQPPANPPAREAAPTYQPGMLDSMGRWFSDSFGRINKNVEGARESLGNFGESAGGVAKGASDAARGAAGAARDAADAVAKFPNARMVDGRERCVKAENGAPDCRKAAEVVCKAKGFASGSSLEIQSAQKCSARAWLAGKQDSGASACEMESFVIRAMCQ